MVYRISEGKKYFILGLVGAIDAVEFILTILQVEVALETIANIIEYGFLWGFFATSGVDYFASKRLGRQAWTGVVEAVPYLGGILPLLTWTVWKTIEESRREDEEREKNEENSNVIRKMNLANKPTRPTNVTRLKKS